MQLTPLEIGIYIQKFLRQIFTNKINIHIDGNIYVVNDKKEFPIYDFWNKKDSELIDDFKDYAFENDYIGTVFFFLSGYWEYLHCDKKDKFDRFPAKESFAYKLGLLEEPVVDILVNRIKQDLCLEYREYYLRPKMFVTHDVDFLGMLDISRLIRTIGADIIKRRDISAVIDKIKSKIKKKDPHSIEHLLDIHKKYGTKGTFFFLPSIQQKETFAGYNVHKHATRLIMDSKRITDLHSSIGIHYDTRYLYGDRLIDDITLLESTLNYKITSGRAHYLMFDIKRSFDIFEKAGLKIDTTGSYADAIGFRFGTSYPFQPYNFDEKRPYDLYEVPLIVMETTLQNCNYMNLTSGEGLNRIKLLIDKVKLYKGVFTLLWHNTSFYTREWRQWEHVYEEVLAYAKDNNYNFITDKDFLKWKAVCEYEDE